MVPPTPVTSPATANSPAPRRLYRRAAMVGAAALGVYVVVAYVIAPLAWNRYERRHPQFDDVPRITETRDHIPGDPLNVALVGSEADVKRIMKAAGWFPADPLSLRADLKIAADTVLKRPYDEAPVSTLYFEGRKEDLAFEKPIGHDPRKRNHVRFWRVDPEGQDDGGANWLGSATLDTHVGLSHTTGEITHHTSPDIDAERDLLFKDLTATGELEDEYTIDDFHEIRQGKNGGGDPWHTDGKLLVGVISPE